MPHLRFPGIGLAVATLLSASACGAGHAMTAAATSSHATSLSHTTSSHATSSRSALAGTSADAPADPSLPPPPATTSGPLTKANLPSASRIGAGFRAYVEPDTPEEGIVSNGSAVHARDPQQTADGMVPLGCPGVDSLPRLPVPAHALEETYRTPEGLAAVALTLEYGSRDQAAALVDRLAAMLATCRPPISSARISTPQLVADVRQPDAASVFDTRREVGPDAATNQWDETVVRKGTRVLLVIIERQPKAPVRNQRSLASNLRTLLAN